MTPFIEDKLQELSRHMNAVSLMMLEAGDNRVVAHGIELQGASSQIYEWIAESKADEQSEQDVCPKCDGTGIVVRWAGKNLECDCNRGGAR